MNKALDPLVAQFAQHVATRDDPPPYVPPRQDREAILERLDAALRQLGVRLRNRRATLARLCLALAPQPRATAAQLAQELVLSRQTVWMAMGLLLPPGLVANDKEGRNRYYRYTRAGEDWLLPLLTGEAAVGRGSGALGCEAIGVKNGRRVSGGGGQCLTRDETALGVVPLFLAD
jgi:hypothetical protein